MQNRFVSGMKDRIDELEELREKDEEKWKKLYL